MGFLNQFEIGDQSLGFFGETKTNHADTHLFYLFFPSFLSFVPSTAHLVKNSRMTKNDDALAMQLGPPISHADARGVFFFFFFGLFS